MRLTPHHSEQHGARQWWLIWVGACLMFLSSAAHADQITIDSHRHFALAPHFDYFADDTGKLALADILSESVQARFQPIQGTGASTNFGITSSALWFRIDMRLTPEANSRWMLEVANPQLEHVEVALIRPDGSISRHMGGIAIPFSQRAVAHRFHVFELTLSPGNTNTLYLRVQTNSTLSVGTNLWEPLALQEDSLLSYTCLSLYFGLMIGLSLYNLMLYLSTRDRAYLVYVGFSLSMAYYQLALTGMGGQYFWGDAVWWSPKAPPVGVALTSCLGTLFARYFLSTPTRAPRVDKALRALVGVWLLLLLIPLVTPFKIPIGAVALLVLLTLALLIGTGIQSAMQGHREARFFLLSWAAVFVGAGVLLLYITGFIGSGPLSAYSLLVGSAVEMILLSFALADRINALRQHNEVVQRQSLAEQATVLALRKSQDDYRAVIEQVGEGMVIVQGARVVFANTQAVAILARSSGEILQSGFVAPIHPDDRAQFTQRLEDRLLNRSVPPRYEARCIWPDQSIHWLEIGDSRIPWDGGTAVLIFFLDQTERKNAERDTRVALARQQELNDLRSRFVAMTSHEFRTPLAGILSSYELIKEYDSRLSAQEKKKILEIIAAGVHRMTGMLDRVLLLGKADAHMLEFKPTVVNLTALCQELAADARASIGNSPCQLVANIDAPGDDRLFDEKLLRHIFGNLLSNAIKYSPKGGVIEFVVRTDGKYTEFTVTDQGIGIPADEMGDLFESFHRARNVGSIAGTGLGLAIVKSSVTLHGGDITVESEIGKGTRFSVRI